MIYAGIDEAGYGPTLGPFTLGLAAFRVPDPAPGRSPDLFAALAAAVAPSAERGRTRIAVADSKSLYTQGAGFTRLEEALYSFQLAGGSELPSTLQQLLAWLLHPSSSDPAGSPWSQDLASAAPLPRHAAETDLRASALQLGEAMRASGTHLVHLRVVHTGAGAWNESLARTQNKSVTAFRRVRRLLRELWDEHGEEGVLAQVDKQGGRSFYLPLLQEEFPALAVCAVTESKLASCYRIKEGGRRMQVVFEPRAESRHLPVALASIGAKYVRELMMERFNAYFGAHAPELRPTAGYPQDARRWLRETADLRARLGIADEALVRVR